MTKLVATAATGFLVMSGCTSYTAKPVVIHDLNVYQFSEERGGIRVIADPYDTRKKYKNVFNTKPSFERGYVGVNIVVANETESPVRLDASGVWATSRSGQTIRPIPAEQVGEQVLRSTTGRYFAGGVIAAGSSKGANEKIRMDFRNKELKSATIYPGQIVHGFLFFPTEPVVGDIVVGGLRQNEEELDPVTVSIVLNPSAFSAAQ